MSENPYYNLVMIEAVSRRFRELQQAEALKQNNGVLDSEAMTEYDDLPENIKEFYRVLARHVLNRFEGAVFALRFYADDKNWLEIKESGIESKNVFDDCGERARMELVKLGLKP